MNVAISRDTFQRCFSLARDMESKGRIADAVALLRSLQVYLDNLPAFPDGSCKNTVKGVLARMTGQLPKDEGEKTS